MAGPSNEFDLILNTVSAGLKPDRFMYLLGIGRTLVTLGLPSNLFRWAIGL